MRIHGHFVQGPKKQGLFYAVLSEPVAFGEARVTLTHQLPQTVTGAPRVKGWLGMVDGEIRTALGVWQVKTARDGSLVAIPKN